MTALSRRTVTSATRIMLPTYAAFFSLIGYGYLTTPVVKLLKTPGLAYAHDRLHIGAWGAMFLGVSMLLVTAMLHGGRTLCRFALWVGVVCMAIWVVVMVAAAILAEASPTAAAWPGVIGMACYATERSVRREEVS